MINGYSPFDREVQEDPYPAYAWLRESAPVYRNDDADFWALSRYADVAAAWPDSERFSSANGVHLEPTSWGPDAWRFYSFLAMDPPRHTRIRGLVAGGFTGRRVANLEPFIRDIARRYVQAGVEKGSFDFHRDFAAPLPADVINELVGVPESDRPEVRRLTDTVALHGGNESEVPAATLEAAFALAGYLQDLIGQRRREPRDDLATVLVQAADEDGPLAQDEIVSVLFMIGIAGTETTTRLLGNAWYDAWRHPDERAQAWAGNVTGWVNETLRYDTPIQYTARTAAEDLELHGVRVPAGARMVLLAGAANRDGQVFPEPDRYDIGRDTSQALPFGRGRHFCLGAPLARLEAQIALKELIRVIGSYEIDEADAVRVHSPEVRGFASLPTTVKPR
jgi:cytochrome P450